MAFTCRFRGAPSRNLPAWRGQVRRLGPQADGAQHHAAISRTPRIMPDRNPIQVEGGPGVQRRTQSKDGGIRALQERPCSCIGGNGFLEATERLRGAFHVRYHSRHTSVPRRLHSRAHKGVWDVVGAVPVWLCPLCMHYLPPRNTRASKGHGYFNPADVHC